MIEPKIFSVGQINRYIKNLMENDFILNSLFVKGEISNFKAHSSGHLYFTLKDGAAAISCVMFKEDAKILPFIPENGMSVVLCGHISLYERSGQYQMYAQMMDPVGMGALQIAFEQLKAKLLEEGLFDDDFKREIPKHIQTVAVVTSPTGAVIRDIIHIIRRRDHRVKIGLFPALVQGESAGESIAKALRFANEWGKADVIILGRGGGSIEDLWAFNEEKVVRSIFASELPVISAVGHETDFTLSDFVADLRAPTPSAAAELVTEPIRQRMKETEQLEERLGRSVMGILETAVRRWEYLKNRPVLKRPLESIYQEQIRLAQNEKRLAQNIKNRLHLFGERLAAKSTRLEAVSPLSVMKRGYALVEMAGNAVTSVNQVKIGDVLQLRLKDGNLLTKVEEKAVEKGNGEKETIL